MGGGGSRAKPYEYVIGRDGASLNGEVRARGAGGFAGTLVGRQWELIFHHKVQTTGFQPVSFSSKM
jgi:hypothetical protein